MKQAWNEVADGFSNLGRMMKERYHGAGEEEAAQVGDAGSALAHAFDRLIAATREVGDRAADVRARRGRQGAGEAGRVDTQRGLRDHRRADR